MAISCKARPDARTRSPLLALLLTAPALAAAQAQVFEGYEAYYATLPGTLFKAADARSLDARSPPGDDAVYLRWRGAAGGQKIRSIDIGNGNLVIDRQAVRIEGARTFPGETARAEDLGRGAVAYLAAGWACVESAPPPASGAAVRRKSVYLLRVGGAQALAWKLPGLFASCTNIRRDGGQLRFDQAQYRYDQGRDVPAGVLFKEYAIGRDNEFVATGRTRAAAFAEPGNVYRFSLEQR